MDGLGADLDVTVKRAAAAGVHACCLLSNSRLHLMALEEGDEGEADLLPVDIDGGEEGEGGGGVWEEVEAMCMFGVQVCVERGGGVSGSYVQCGTEWNIYPRMIPCDPIEALVSLGITFGIPWDQIGHPVRNAMAAFMPWCFSGGGSCICSGGSSNGGSSTGGSSNGNSSSNNNDNNVCLEQGERSVFPLFPRSTTTPARPGSLRRPLSLLCLAATRLPNDAPSARLRLERDAWSMAK